MVKHNTLPMVYDNSRPARIGLLRRDAADAANVQWFEAGPLCFILQYHCQMLICPRCSCECAFDVPTAWLPLV